MITERTLKQWRAEALEAKQAIQKINMDQVKEDPNCPTMLITTMADRILRLTMALMDIQLLERMKGRKS